MLTGMSFWNSIKGAATAFGRWMLEVPDLDGSHAYGHAPIPTRQRQSVVTVERALSLSTFYRGIQIHATAACQLPLITERNGKPTSDTHDLVRKPYSGMSRSAFIEYTIVSLYIDGNAFWRIVRNPAGAIIDLEPLNPNEVTVNVEMDRFNVETINYGWRGKKLTGDEIRHLQLLRIPGMHRGLGPIQAARVEVLGALDARDYGAMWLNNNSIPDGVLTTDQELGPGDADKYKHVWYDRTPDGKEKPDTAPKFGENERLRVLGKGLTYTPLALKPSDVQFLESQQFSTLQMTRLIGAPASEMLVAVEGANETYTNVEQSWIGYLRFGLMKPLREIEEALTSVTPGIQVVRFNVEGLLRTDTKTRYEAHAMSLNPETGWATEDEVRAIEGMPELTPEQRAEREARRNNTRKEAVNA